MLRLNVTSEPRWMDFGGGLRLLLLPADIEVIVAAQDELADAAAEEVSVRKVGIPLAQAVARRVVVAWEGVGDVDGNPFPEPFPEGIDALIRHAAVFTTFQNEFLLPALQLAEEGNGFALSPSGTSAGAPTTAQPAQAGARTARPSKKPR